MGIYGEEALFEFFTYTNSFHETIKFTWEWSKNDLPFLDVLVKLRNNRLITDVYWKPTDTHKALL